MKKLLVFVCVISMMLIALSGSTLQAEEGKAFRVGIVQIVDHPALDDTRNGFISQMTELGYIEGNNITYDIQSAQGDLSLAKAIADKFVADRVDLILAITTPAAQASAKATRKIPLVFVGVSDPIGAGLLKTVAEPSGTNVTGVYNFDSLKVQLELFLRIMPEMKKLGVIYNAGESNSNTNVKNLRQITADNGLKLVEGTVASTNEIKMVAESLARQVDAIYMPQDNTVASGLDALIKVCETSEVPLFVGDINSVQSGAIATYGDDQAGKGRQVAYVVDKVLKGTEPGELTPEQVKERQLTLNLGAAAKMGITIPQAVVDEADTLIE